MNFKPDNDIDTTAPALGRRTKSLRRRIQAGFLLAVLLTLLTGGGLTIQLTGVEGSSPFAALETAAANQQEGPEELMMRVRYALMGGTCLALAVLCALYIFIVRCILHPLEHTATAARRMVDGRLDATVPIQDADEIGRIGELFNDMGVNLQELLLLVWNQTGSALTALESIHQQLESRQAAARENVIRAHLQAARQNLGTMQTVARSFDLYDVLLTGHKAVAREDLTDRAN